MSQQNSKSQISRRTLLGTAAGAAVATALPTSPATAQKPASGKVVRNGRIKQSIVHWCFAKHWDSEKIAKTAKELGCVSVELAPAKDFPILKKHGLVCAIGTIDMAPDPPFVKGFNNPKHHAKVIEATTKAIDECAEYGFKNVICFTGMADGMSDEDGARNCVAGLKKIVGYAEKKGITLCLEMLNTRDDSDPMKGHPGYQGDNTEYCIEIIKKVGSRNLKLLFDIYHVQIMDGDVIRRIRQHKDYIGHIHTAGNPGRGELNDNQEINYKAVMQALLDVGYKGYVGQEFIPTIDPMVGLRQAVALCDV